MKKGKLFLIPNVLGENSIERVICAEIKATIQNLDEFIVENSKIARRYLRDLGTPIPLNDLIFHELNKRTIETEANQFLNAILKGKNLGLISDAGCPGIADPGAKIVALAHQMGIEVVPLVGPSSIFLALMASGFNGQSFAFHGYLPIEKNARKKRLLQLEKNAKQFNQSQIFIETPYRNNQLIESILQICQNQTKLCIACNLTLENQFIQSKFISEWRKIKLSFHKQPCVFLLF